MGVEQSTMIQIILLLTLVVTKGFEVYNERQKRARERELRAWDLEDRERARQELAAKVATTHEKVIEKIEENTNLSREAFTAGREAYTEANNVNAKLLTISTQIGKASGDRRGEEMRRMADENIQGILKTTAETAAKVEETQAVVDDTHTKVENIERKLQ